MSTMTTTSVIPAAALPLLVALPLVAGVLTAVLSSVLLRRVLSLALVAATGAVGLTLLLTLGPAGTTEGLLVTHVGGFLPGVAIPLIADHLTALMLLATSVVSGASLTLAAITDEDRENRYLAGLALVLVAGVNGALMTGDLFNLFVFIEIMLMPSYALLAMTGTWKRLGAGRLFVVVNIITSTAFLVGVTYIYGTFGAVNLAVLADGARHNTSTTVALVVALCALGIKAGVFPAYGWLPRTYPATSASVMGLFSGLHTKVAVYAIYRIVAVTFDFDPRWHLVVLAVLVLTMVIGAIGSLGEKTIRSALAFQMVCGVGYILLGLGLAAAARGAGTGAEARAALVFGLSAGIFYMLHHMVTMGGLILLSGAIENTYGTGQFDRIQGLQRREPWLAFFFAAGALSLVGFPPFTGVLAKYGSVATAASVSELQDVRVAGYLALGGIALASLGALVSMLMVWRRVLWQSDHARFRPTPKASWQEIPEDLRVGARRLFPGAALLVLSFLLFVGAGPVGDVVSHAVTDLVDHSSYSEAVLRP